MKPGTGVGGIRQDGDKKINGLRLKQVAIRRQRFVVPGWHTPDRLVGL